MKKVGIFFIYLIFAIVVIWLFYYMIVNSVYVSIIKQLYYMLKDIWEIWE